MHQNKNYFTCSKCGKHIHIDYKYIHPVKCPMKNNKKDSNSYDYKCEICGIKMNIKEKDDHLFSHKLQNNEYQNNRNSKRNINNENLNNFSISNSNGSSDSDSNSDSDSSESSENKNKEILSKIVEKFNKNGFTKIKLINARKDELKPILREIYQEYHSFVGMENSPKEAFREGCREIIQEFREKEEKDPNFIKYTILKDYPITKIKSISKLSEENQQCLICLENFKKGDESIILPCIHIFHSKCIAAWVKKSHTCPVCKYKIEPIK